MNECFFIGKIIGNIEFKFIKQKRNSKHNSISLFKLQLFDENIINVKVYDEIADLCYSKLEENDFVYITGRIDTIGTISIKYIKKI